jgi:hypothetical protein
MTTIPKQDIAWRVVNGQIIVDNYKMLLIVTPTKKIANTVVDNS